MKKLIPFIISSFLVAGAFGCQEAPTTSSENPSTSNDAMSVPTKEAAQTDPVKTDPAKIEEPPVTATKEVPKQIKVAAESVRTNVVKTKTATSQTTSGIIEENNLLKTNNLKSLAYSKLQEKIPDSNLEVADRNGAVTVTGTVLSPADLEKITPIVQQIAGVKTVKIAAKVLNEKKPQQDNN